MTVTSSIKVMPKPRTPPRQSPLRQGKADETEREDAEETPPPRGLGKFVDKLA